MRKSRVLLAGVAVAAAGAATSAFTASNTFNTLDNNVAGYGEVSATGVNVSNIAYTPATADGSKLQSVVFTVDQDTTSMAARMTLYLANSVTPASTSTCVSSVAAGPVYRITCTLTVTVNFADFDETGLTVTSN